MGDLARHRGAASTALEPLVGGPSTVGRVAGTTSGMAWLMVGETAMVVAGPAAVRLPNAFVLSGNRWRSARVGDPVVVGEGCLVVGGAPVGVGRWWEARPSLRRVDGPTLRNATSRCDPGCVDDGGLGRALAGGDDGGAVRTAAGLLGAGDGLTPLGDDVLAGAIAALVVLGAAAGIDDLPVATALIGWVLSAAQARTTSLSASLLHCAAAGRVAEPVARLLRALGGMDDVAPARAATLGIGHSSGGGLLAGVLAGAACVAGALA
jgi:hypothetical protein